ncbi:MAG: extracellular solute-binding protein [Chloroflexota bacterium]|nr:extracellular solute-binding protein [Chloroflexota bacterium]
MEINDREASKNQEGAATDQALSRRGFMRLAAGGALAGAVGLPFLLDACGGTAQVSGGASSGGAAGSASAASSGAAKAAALKLPTYVPFVGPKPDFAPSADGVVPPGYLTYPKDLAKFTKGPVGKGDDVSVFTYEINPPPTAADQNPAWQQINKDLGVNLKFTNVALQDYNTKLSTVIAGGDLPDLFSMNVLDVLIPNELEFFESRAADLTPYVSGDAIKEYPNLANFPPLAWKSTVFNGKIFALPRVTNGVGSAMIVQQNLMDEAGVKEFKNVDDFTKFMQAVTKQGQWGIGGVKANTMQWMLGVFRAPNNWKESGGKFTKDWETEEYKEAVAYLRKLWDLKVVSPDTPTFIAQQGAAKFYAGKFAMYPTDFFAFDIAWQRLLGINKNFKLNGVVEFGHDGGKGTHFQNKGIVQIAVLKKSSPDRIKELLGVANYLSAPFGTQEKLGLDFGVKSVDYNLNDKGNPHRTKKGISDVQYSPWGTIINGPQVLFDGESPESTKVAYPIESAAHEIAVTDPTIGLYSATDAAKRAILTQKVWDAVDAIIFGRSPVSSLDQVVKDWRSGGGDQIRSEMGKAFEKASK